MCMRCEKRQVFEAGSWKQGSRSSWRGLLRLKRCRHTLYTEYTPVACITNTTVFSQAQITSVLVAQDVMGCSIFVRMKIVGHPVSHVIPLLVSTSPSHFQSTTTRSTTWTARPYPRRHCTPSTSSRIYTVDKQRK